MPALPNGYALNRNANISSYVSYDSQGMTKLASGAFQAQAQILTDRILNRGPAFLEAVRAANPRQDVVMITSMQSLRKAVEAVKRGAAGYLTKPVDGDELLLLLRQIARLAAHLAQVLGKLLLEARSVAFPDPGTPSGSHLARVIAQLGISAAMQPKLIHKGAIRGGGELVANGEADVGLYLVSEVQTIKGVSVAGLLPPALQSFVVYSAAIPAYNATPDAALSFIRFVSEPGKGERWKAAGFELVDSR